MYKGSNVTPRILGVLTVGTGVLSMRICGRALTWLVQGVNRVTEDISGAILSLFAVTQSATGAKASERRGAMTDASLVILGWETATVTSSA